MSKPWSGYDYAPDAKNLTSFIRKLRKKIAPDPDNPQYIISVWGVGHKIHREITKLKREAIILIDYKASLFLESYCRIKAHSKVVKQIVFRPNIIGKYSVYAENQHFCFNFPLKIKTLLRIDI